MAYACICHLFFVPLQPKQKNIRIMLDKLVKGALVFAAGAAVGAWLMSEDGAKTRSELKDLAAQVKDKIRKGCEQYGERAEANDGAETAAV